MNYLTLACSQSNGMGYLKSDDVVTDTINGTWDEENYTLPDGIYIASITPDNTSMLYLSGTTITVKENGTIIRTVNSSITNKNNSGLTDVIIATSGTTVQVTFYSATSGNCNASVRLVKMS